jgi:polar amino acid transport system substrate-binding protein
MQRIAVLVFAVMSAFASTEELSSQFSELRILTEDYPPLNYLENGKLTGASTEILALVYEQLGLPFPEVEVMPWPGAYHLAQTNQPIMLFTMSRTATREDKFQWAGQTHASRTYLVTYEGSGIDEYDPKTQRDESILAIRSDVTQYVLEELGYPTEKLDLVDSNEKMIRMFSNQREKLMSIADSPFNTLKKTDEFKDFPFKVLTTTRESQGHFAFSLGVDPALVAAFQSGLEQVRDEQKKILEKYDMNY